MSATAKVVRDFLARVDAGRVEPEDFGLTAEDVEALRDEHGGIPLVNGARIREESAHASEGLVLYVQGALKEHPLGHVLADVAKVVANYTHESEKDALIRERLDIGIVEAEARHAIHAALAILDTVISTAGLSRVPE